MGKVLFETLIGDLVNEMLIMRRWKLIIIEITIKIKVVVLFCCECIMCSIFKIQLSNH